MTWKYEIYRSLFIAFGAMQTISNTIYLTRQNGIELSKKQHKELPDTATNQLYFVKIRCMLTFGIIFFLTGCYATFFRLQDFIGFIIVLSLYTFYTFMEAIYYRYWKTTGAFLLPLALLIIYLIV